MQAEQVINYVRVEDKEYADPEKSGKGVILDGVEYRDSIGQHAKIITNEGEVYEGEIVKVSSLKGKTDKDIVLLSSSGIRHGVPYEFIEEIEVIEKENAEEDEE